MFYREISHRNKTHKRNELVTKCRHKNKFSFANYKDIPPKLLNTFFPKRL